MLGEIVCKGCGRLLQSNEDNFYFRSGKIKFPCKKCVRKRVKEWKKNNREKLLENRKRYYLKHKNEISTKNKNYRKENPEEARKKDKEKRNKDISGIRTARKKYADANRNKINAKARAKYKEKYYSNIELSRKIVRQNAKKLREKGYFRKKYSEYKDSPDFKIRNAVKVSIYSFIKSKGKSKGGESILKYLNYNICDLRKHIESLFEPWMNWDNYGKYDPNTWDDNNSSTWTWQLDHIIPQATFKYTTMDCEEFRKCWALKNLRPYSAKQNILDGVNRVRHR